MQRKKSPKVIERKLGKHKAVGLAWQEDGIIEIDPRQKPKEYLSTLIHEAAHIIYPDWDEKDIVFLEKKLVPFLWKHNVRIVKQ